MKKSFCLLIIFCVIIFSGCSDGQAEPTAALTEAPTEANINSLPTNIYTFNDLHFDLPNNMYARFIMDNTTLAPYYTMISFIADDTPTLMITSKDWSSKGINLENYVTDLLAPLSELTAYEEFSRTAYGYDGGNVYCLFYSYISDEQELIYRYSAYAFSDKKMFDIDLTIPKYTDEYTKFADTFMRSIQVY